MTVHGALPAAGYLLLVSVILLYSSRLPGMDATGISRAPASMPGQSSFIFNTRRGVVLVSIGYRIPAERIRDFVRATQPLRRLRPRNGTEHWSLFRDVSNPEVRQELFLVDNWTQHLRMLDCMTLTDKIIVGNVTALYAGGSLPQIRHCVSHEASNYDMPLVKSATPSASGEAGATAGS